MTALAPYLSTFLLEHLPPMLKPGRFQAPDKLLAMLQQAGHAKKYVE